MPFSCRRAPARRRWRYPSVRALAALAALATPAAARAQTIVLNVPDTQVVDTTIRNGAYATYNHNNGSLVTRSSTVPGWERRAILSFNASSVPSGTVVTSATLTLTLKSGLGTAGARRTVEVRRLAASFVERQATWLPRQSGVPRNTPGGDLAEAIATSEVTNVAGTKITFNVTPIVQQAVNGSFGRQVRLALIDVDGGGDARDSYREYHSSEATTASYRPQLTISYGTTSGTTIDVPPGGSLQTALDQVPAGGTVRLAAGATYVGNFRLPAKGGTSYVTITTASATLPPAGTRIDPSFKAGRQRRDRRTAWPPCAPTPAPATIASSGSPLRPTRTATATSSRSAATRRRP